MIYSPAERTGILIHFHRFSTNAALGFDRLNPRGNNRFVIARNSLAGSLRACHKTRQRDGNRKSLAAT